MPDPTSRVVRDDTYTARVKVSVGPVDGDPLGTYGWFIGVRARGRHPDFAERAGQRDYARYGRCVICRSPFGDDDQVHMVFSVVRNGKTIGNRLCCPGCAGKFATHFHTTMKASGHV